MNRLIYFLSTLCLVLLTAACVQDDVLEDYVDPQLQITNPVDSLTVDSTHQLSYRYLDAIGRVTEVSPDWASDAPEVASVNSGQLTAHAPGTARISATYTDPLARNELPTAAFDVAVVAAPVVIETMDADTAKGTVATTTFYDLTGSFTMTEEDGGVRLTFAEDYVADDGLPGLYLYLTNNPNSITGAAQVGMVEVFMGQHEYFVPDVALRDFSHLLYYCLPFRVKVGDGTIEFD